MSNTTIHALVPHPESSAVLVVDDGYTLPAIQVDSDDKIDARLWALARQHGIDSPFLRRATQATVDGLEMVVKEFEAVPANDRQWLPFDKVSQLALPEQLRPALEEWLAHQRGRAYHEYRPAWSRPGWYEPTTQWLTATLTRHGIEPVGRPDVVQQWAISSVLRQPTRDHGNHFLKSVFGGPGRAFWHEPALSAALSREHPGAVASVTATDTDNGLMVMSDMAVSMLEDRPYSEWDLGLPALAAIQRAWVDRRAEVLGLGCPDRGPAMLADYIATAAEYGPFTDGLTTTEHRRLAELVPQFRQLCDEVNDWPVPLSLGHGDFHAGNVGVRDDGGVVVFDWSDGAWTHPFFDAALYTRDSPAEQRSRLWDGYLECWTDYAPLRELRQLIPAAELLTLLYQVETFRGILSNLAPEDSFVFSASPLRHWRKVLQAWGGEKAA